MSGQPLTGPRLRVSAPAFEAARATEPSPRVGAAVLAELASAGALVRDQDGTVLVDPVLQVLLRRWEQAPVVVEAARATGGTLNRARAGLDGAVAVCVVSTTSSDGDEGPVEVSVLAVADLLSEMLRAVGAGGAVVDDVWLRVTGPTRTWVDRCVGLDSAEVRRRVTSALVQALQDVALTGGALQDVAPQGPSAGRDASCG